MPQLKQAVQRRMQRPPIPDDAPKRFVDHSLNCRDYAERDRDTYGCVAFVQLA